MHHAEFEHPRVVEVYDAESPWSYQDDFFIEVIEEHTPVTQSGEGVARVLDLGCGTGRLAMGLAARGYAVTGVDPARASLDIAHAREGSEHVTWIEGTSSQIPPTGFTAALMTSHVAQFFLTDVEWRRTLDDLYGALIPGGIVTFDARDAAAREWDSWNPADSQRSVTLSDGRTINVWTEVTDERADLVSFRQRYLFPDGEELSSTATLRFRTLLEITSSLSESGFTIDQVYGGWGREPVGRGDGEFLVIARRIDP